MVAAALRCLPALMLRQRTISRRAVLLLLCVGVAFHFASVASQPPLVTYVVNIPTPNGAGGAPIPNGNCIYRYSCVDAAGVIQHSYVGQSTTCLTRLRGRACRLVKWAKFANMYRFPEGQTILADLELGKRGSWFNHDACIVKACHGTAMQLEYYIPSPGFSLNDHETTRIITDGTNGGNPSGCNRNNGPGMLVGILPILVAAAAPLPAAYPGPGGPAAFAAALVVYYGQVNRWITVPTMTVVGALPGAPAGAGGFIGVATPGLPPPSLYPGPPLGTVKPNAGTPGVMREVT